MNIRVAVVVLCLLVTLTPIALSQNVKVQQLLRRFNKPPLKSIQSPDGDIIDCILIHQQPAFDHPLLKDHVIQMRPSFEQQGRVKKTNEATQLWHSVNQTCPQGTVPIRRTKEEDLLRSVDHFPSSFYTPAANPPSNHEYATIEEQGEFYGTQATINVWQPAVELTSEFSVSQFWLVSGSFQQNDLNTIEAGWQVHPALYGDMKSRFFIYWTKDAYQQTGCHNLMCPGFVQTSTKIAVGVVLTPVSVVGGPLYDIHLQVLKDKNDGKWWLKYGDEMVGYWPAELFTTLAGSAQRVSWGGEIINEAVNGRHTGTDMGSGRFAEEDVRKASYFMNIEVADATGSFIQAKGNGLRADHPRCYNILYGNSDQMGAHFFYGGPGNNPNCP